MCEILTDRTRGRANIDSKFVRAWPGARVKPIKRHPDNIFIRGEMQNVARRVPWYPLFFFSSSRLGIVTSSRILWDILKDSPARPVPSPLREHHRTTRAIYIYFARIVTHSGGCKWHVLSRNVLISNGALAVTWASDVVDRMQYIAW